MIPIGINTYSYIWSMPATACVRRLADLGYVSFELMVHPGHLPLDEPDAGERRCLAVLLRRVGARGCSLNMPSVDQNLASALPRVRAFSVAMFRDAIDLASDLEIEWLVTVPGRVSPLAPPPIERRAAWMRESLEALLPHAEARGVRLAVENVPNAAFPDAASLGRFVRAFASDRVGVCYDAANAYFVGESPTEGIAALADVLRVFHLSDTGRQTWRHDRVGTGTVPFAELAPALAAAGFAGPAILEIIDEAPEDAIRASHAALSRVGFAAPPGAAPAESASPESAPSASTP